MDYRIFNVYADANACDHLQGGRVRGIETVRESAWKVDSGRKIPCHRRGIKPMSVECLSYALPTELPPHPLLSLWFKIIFKRKRNAAGCVFALRLWLESDSDTKLAFDASVNV